MDDRLRKFIVIVEQGSFTKAALKLHISQPALTTSIKNLENELKTTLIERKPRSLNLTPAGELVYQAAKRLSVEQNNLAHNLDELKKAPKPLRIGLIDSIGSQLFNNSYELIDNPISVVVNNSQYLISEVFNNRIDIAYVIEQQTYPYGVKATLLGEEPMILVCNQSLREQTQKALTNKRIPGFISYNQASTTYQIIQSRLLSLGLKIETTMSSTSPELIKQLVVMGKGVAVLPYSMVSNELGNTLLNELVVNKLDLKRPIVSVSIDGAKIPSALENFDQYIKQLLN